MIVKGQVRGNTQWLANHLTSDINNESVTILSSSVDGNIHQCLEKMQILHGSDSRCVLHGKIAVEPDKATQLGKQDWQTIFDQYIKFYKLEDHANIAVLHEKNGRYHMHVVSSVKDYNGKRFNDWQIFKRNMACQKVICENLPNLGLSPAQRGQDQRGNPKAKSRKSDSDHLRETANPPKPGLSADEVAQELGRIVNSVSVEQDPVIRAAKIQGKLAANGFSMVMGKRGPGVIHIDDPLTFHHLGRRLGWKAKETEIITIGLTLPDFVDAKNNSNEVCETQLEKARKAIKIQPEGKVESKQLPVIKKNIVNDELPYKYNGCTPIVKSFDALIYERVKLKQYLEKEGFPTSGVWQSKNGNYDIFNLKNSNETISVYKNKISIQNPSKSIASDDSIKAMIATAKTKGWNKISLTGSLEFRQRSADLAFEAGLTVGDTDLIDYLKNKFPKSQQQEIINEDYWNSDIKIEENSKIYNELKAVIEPIYNMGINGDKNYANMLNYIILDRSYDVKKYRDRVEIFIEDLDISEDRKSSMLSHIREIKEKYNPEVEKFSITKQLAMLEKLESNSKNYQQTTEDTYAPRTPRM